jgi:low affinity Fe/Cu permease
MYELIKVSGKARDELIGLEKRGEDEIEHIRIDEGSGAKASKVTSISARGTRRKRS